MLSTSMVAARALYSGEIFFLFLVWNLILAWLPLIFAWLAYQRPMTVPIFGPLWLLFFPNAPYMVTDLIHLQSTPSALVWYDALMLFAFALTGLLLGFLSLSLVQHLVVRRLGPVAGWLFAILALGLSSFGVYIGRFLRWNSWDVFTRPLPLAHDILNTLATPHAFPKMLTVSLLLAAVMMLAYVTIYSLPHLFARS